MRFAFFIPLFVPILAACATLDEDECRSGNWEAVGERDGADGRSERFVQNHFEACAEYGVQPDVAEWEAGRQDGLEYYCTPQRAFEIGRRGRYISPVCPTSQIKELTYQNDRGLRLHHIEREIRQIENEIDAINHALAKLPAGDPKRTSLVSERSFLHLDLLSLRAERGRYL